jgi:hypothetical protein
MVDDKDFAPGFLERVCDLQQGQRGFPDSVRDAALAATQGLTEWNAIWAMSDVIEAWQRAQRNHK